METDKTTMIRFSPVTNKMYIHTEGLWGQTGSRDLCLCANICQLWNVKDLDDYKININKIRELLEITHSAGGMACRGHQQ